MTHDVISNSKIVDYTTIDTGSAVTTLVSNYTHHKQMLDFPLDVSITEIFNTDYNYLLHLIIDNVQDNHFSNLTFYEKTLVLKDIKKRKVLLDKEFKAYASTSSDHALLEKIAKHLKIIDDQIEQWSTLTSPSTDEQQHNTQFLEELKIMIEFNVNMNALVTYGDFIPDTNMQATLDNFLKKINAFEEKYKQQLTKLPVTKEVDVAYDIYRYYQLSSDNKEKIEILGQKLLAMNNDIKTITDSIHLTSDKQNTKFNKKSKFDKLEQSQQNNTISSTEVMYEKQSIGEVSKEVNLKSISHSNEGQLVQCDGIVCSNEIVITSSNDLITARQPTIFTTITGDMLEEILNSL